MSKGERSCSYLLSQGKDQSEHKTEYEYLSGELGIQQACTNLDVNAVFLSIEHAVSLVKMIKSYLLL